MATFALVFDFFRHFETDSSQSEAELVVVEAWVSFVHRFAVRVRVHLDVVACSFVIVEESLRPVLSDCYFCNDIADGFFRYEIDGYLCFVKHSDEVHDGKLLLLQTEVSPVVKLLKTKVRFFSSGSLSGGTQ